MVFRHLPPPDSSRDGRATHGAAIAVATCTLGRCERERRAALAALAHAYAREAVLVGRFDTMVETADARHQPVLTDEVGDVLSARDWALARLQEWSP